MTVKQKSPGQRQRGVGQGTVIGLGQPTASARQNRLMATAGATLPDGYGRCGLCGKILQLRNDGTLRGHRSSDKIPCLGARPTT